MGRHWRELVWASLLACGCASTRTGGGTAAPLAPVYSTSGVSAEFFPAFDALRATVDAHDDDLARRLLQRTLTRMQARREASWEGMSATERSGQEAAEALAAGFERILDGRERVAALEFTLAVEPRGVVMELVLRVDSSWPAALSVRPGPATLREEFVWVTPLGRETRTVRYMGLDQLTGFEVAPDRPWRMRLTDVAASIPGAAIAGRRSWSLVLRSGAVVEHDASYPGMRWGITPTEWNARADYLPITAVEPMELADYLSEVDITRPARNQIMPPMMERAIRIEAPRRAEALALLKPLVERSAAETIERMIPVLRWLSRTAAPGGDPAEWRRWMAMYGEVKEKRVEGGLDLPRGPIG